MKFQRMHDERMDLYNANVNWAMKLARRATGRYLQSHAQDLRNEALLGLWEATEVWDPERGTFTNCATWWIRRRLFSAARELSTLKIPSHRPKQPDYVEAWTRAQQPALSLNDEDGPGGWNALVDRNDPVESAILSERLELLRSKLSRLPETERQIVELLLQGRSLTEISDELGIPKWKITRTAGAARKRLALVWLSNRPSDARRCA